MTAHKDSGFIVVEDFFSPEEADFLCQFALNNYQEDPREFYGFYPLGSDDLIDRSRNNGFDDQRIYEAMKYAFHYFKDNFDIVGNLTFNRAHFNLMFEGALLHDHADEDPNSQGEYDQTRRSYILSAFLNDDYEGGQFAFEEQGALFTPKKGSLVLFPGWCTRHGVRKVTKGTRVNILAAFHDILAEEQTYTI